MGETARQQPRAGIPHVASLRVNPERLERMWAMGPADRVAAAQRGEFTLGEMLRWASRRPHEVDLVDGELWFITALSADAAVGDDSRWTRSKLTGHGEDNRRGNWTIRRARTDPSRSRNSTASRGDSCCCSRGASRPWRARRDTMPLLARGEASFTASPKGNAQDTDSAALRQYRHVHRRGATRSPLRYPVGALPHSYWEGCGVSASFDSCEPSVLAVHREAWPLRSTLLRRSFWLLGDQTGVRKMAPLIGVVTSRSPVPSGATTHACGMPQVLGEEVQPLKAIIAPFGDHCAESAPRPAGVISRRPVPSAFTTNNPGLNCRVEDTAAKATCAPSGDQSAPTRSKNPRSITDSAEGLSWIGSLPSGFTASSVLWSVESNWANRIRERSGE
jgi:hypothetical protein